MGYPNHPGKHRGRPVFDGQRYLQYLTARGQGPTEPVPAGAILCYSGRLLKYVKEWHGPRPCFHYLQTVHGPSGPVGVAGGFGVGAPVAVTTLEELAALGVRRFVSIGTAGTLQADLAIGDLVVCERALRDEGTSHHYVGPGRFATPSASLLGSFEAALRRRRWRFRRGATWTVDAPYRETVEEVRRYQREGLLTVEMEAAALFAAGRALGVEVAAAFTVSDSLASLTWEPRFDARRCDRGLERLLAVALEVAGAAAQAPRRGC